MKKTLFSAFSNQYYMKGTQNNRSVPCVSKFIPTKGIIGNQRLVIFKCSGFFQ